MERTFNYGDNAVIESESKNIIFVHDSDYNDYLCDKADIENSDCYNNELVEELFEEESYYEEEPDDCGDYYYDMMKDDGYHLENGYWTF